ncbi:hypothetical protein B0T11DRAFT_288487 [Plectosphaerella cucumerina]|uniref:Uncharacterized protein n=1 Tax=Plectosphaerella cucumerina TaxID=40658 RepID=A0A8K0X1K7_9PEZI|nr:hypothetical protein B0T11DRAFT_288487 [Plectosphaerella cucumerina]
MEGVSVAASIIGLTDAFHKAIMTKSLSRQETDQFHNIMTRLELAHTFYNEISRGQQSSSPLNSDSYGVESQFRTVLELLDFREHKSSFFKRNLGTQALALKDAEAAIDNLEFMINQLHRTSLQRQVSQLESTTQSMHKILLVMAELFEYPLEAASGEQGTERNTNIEAMRAKLHETLAANPWASQPRNDPFCFAFVVLPVSPDGGVEPARGQVKIDTGAEDNWISTRLLEMASVPFTPDASLGTFRGANGQPFKPLGRVSVTWYSENQARTQTSDFLIHDSAPFDAILGSGWVLEECLNVFHKPVLPLFRMTIGPDEINDLKKRQEATNASNDEVIALQRFEKRARRERERQEEAQSRALSRITSPTALTRKNSSESLSTFPSFATSKSTAGSSTPGIPAQGSATAGTEPQVPGDNSKGKEKEGSNAATVL